MILLGPLLVERIGLPGIVGVILGGLLVGPFVLGWVERDGVVESLGDLGILVLMFLAGLELDLDEFQANRRGALTFGAFTFTLPFVLGIARRRRSRLRARRRRCSSGRSGRRTRSSRTRSSRSTGSSAIVPWASRAEERS